MKDEGEVEMRGFWNWDSGWNPASGHTVDNKWGFLGETYKNRTHFVYLEFCLSSVKYQNVLHTWKAFRWMRGFHFSLELKWIILTDVFYWLKIAFLPLGVGVVVALNTKQAGKALQYIVVCFFLIFLCPLKNAVIYLTLPTARLNDWCTAINLLWPVF